MFCTQFTIHCMPFRFLKILILKLSNGPMLIISILIVRQEIMLGYWSLVYWACSATGMKDSLANLGFIMLIAKYVNSIEIYEWSGTTWEPYVADDVQVQFYMMSPYVLKTLSTDSKVLLNFILSIILISSLINSWVKFTWLPVLFQDRYFTSFKVRDICGVFQFKVEYDRLGYTSLSLSKQVIADSLFLFFQYF